MTNAILMDLASGPKPSWLGPQNNSTQLFFLLSVIIVIYNAMPYLKYLSMNYNMGQKKSFSSLFISHQLISHHLFTLIISLFHCVYPKHVYHCVFNLSF